MTGASSGLISDASAPFTAVQSGAYANRPNSPVQGQQYYATDYGSTGMMLTWGGSYWKPVGGVGTLYQKGSATVLSSTTAETNVVAIAIPATVPSANGGLRIIFQAVKTGTSGTGTYTVRYSNISGSVNGTAFYSVATSVNTHLSQNAIRTIWNRAVQTSQLTQASTSFGCAESTNTGLVMSINSGSATYLNFNTQVASGSDAAGYDAITVEWFEP